MVHKLGVKPCWVHGLTLDTPTEICGVQVTLVDANHCPGAVQFLFALPDGRRYIHCGRERGVGAVYALAAWLGGARARYTHAICQ